MVTIGSGEHRYQWHEDWAKVPDGVTLGYTHGVVIDSQGRVLIFNQSRDALAAFSPEGEFLGSRGEEFAAGAHGLKRYVEDGAEYLYLTDYVLQAVVKTTPDGQEVLRLSPPDRPDIYDAEHAYKPTDVAVAPDGTIFVCDGYGQSWIHRYSAAGEYLDSFGGKGSEPGQLACPHSAEFDLSGDEPRLVVADRANVRFQCFNLAGEPLGCATADLRYPCGLVLKHGLRYVPDLRSRISIFDADFKLVTHLGDQAGQWQREGWPNLPREQIPEGCCSSPHALTVADDGSIFLVEWIDRGRVVKLEKV